MSKRKTQYERLEAQVVGDGEVSTQTMLLGMGEQVTALAHVLDNGAIRDGAVREGTVRILRKIASFLDLHALAHHGDISKLNDEDRKEAAELFKEPA